MDWIECVIKLSSSKNYVKIIFFSLILFLLFFIIPSYAAQINIHANISGNSTDSECSSCHLTKQVKSFEPALIQQDRKISNIKYVQSNNIQSLAATSVTGNITLIASLGQNWYQQGIYGPNTSNATIDKSWGWTFFDESPPSGFITPSEKVTQKNSIYALLLDSGNNSSPIRGAQVTANITYWIYDGVNYTNYTSPVQLTEDINHSGFYSGNFYFYGGTTYKSGDMSWCDGCHLSIYGGTDTQAGYFPGNYTALITAQVDNKTTTEEVSFEVTPWGCEDCHGSGNQHKTSSVDLDSACYLCHSINQIVHDGTDPGNPHQNTAHRNIKCTDCHTNKSLNSQTFNGVTFTQGGINNASLPQYNYTTTQLNSGTHTNLTCTDCHSDLVLSTPQGDYKQDNYTIRSTINNYTPSFASIQQFQDYYTINVTPSGPLSITLDWEGAANIGFYLYPPNFNPRNRTGSLNPDKGDSPYYTGSTFTNKPEIYTNNTPLAGKWILEIYGYNLSSTWIGTLQPPINYSINSTYPIQQKNLPRIPECKNCHNSTATGGASTKYQIPDWNPGFAHADTNRDGTLDVQCRMCHNAMHNITIKDCHSCHTTAPVNHPINEPAFTQYTPGQCLACHGDPHKVTVTGGGCIACHNSTGARYYVDTSTFGLHTNLNTTEGVNVVNDSDCKECHFNPNMPMMLGAANYSNTYFCEDCHVPGGRNPSQYNNVPSSLRKTAGGHGSADCKWCHIAGWNQTRPLSSELRYHNHGSVSSSGPKGTAAEKNCLTCHYYANLPDLPFHAPGEGHATDTGSCVYCHDSADNHAVTYLNSNTPPSVSGTSVSSPVTSGIPAQVQATVADDMLQIAAAQYQVTDASGGVVIAWINMTPKDGRFNSPSEIVNASIDTSNLEGSYTVKVKGMASAPKTDTSKPYYPLNGKWSSVTSIPFIVIRPTGYVNGTVRDNMGNGITDAAVVTNTSNTMMTDASGFYSLSLINGTYTLTASKDPEYYVNNTILPVTVSAGTTVIREIVMTRKPVYTLSGRVINASSGPGINGALVKLVAYPQYNATTNSTGDYSLVVPEGTYQVSASAPGYVTNTTTVAVNANTLQDFRLINSYQIYVPWTATTQGWTTPYVIANKGNSNASVSISYYNQANGSYAGSYSVSILPGASKFVFREWTTSTDGSAVLVSDQSITVMVDQFNNGENKFGAYEVDPSGSSEVFLPWTATTQGWTTPYVIVNRGTANATVSITYYYINGSVAGSYSVNILPPGASKFVFREWSIGGDGAARISSNQPISVLVDMFKNSENKFGAYTPASTADSQVFIPWTATTQGWTTPFKIMNRGLSAASVNIGYYNQANGLLAGTDSVNVAPNEVVTVLRENSGANGTDGSTVINSTQPVSVIVQQFNNNEGKFEVYTPAMTASDTIVVPWTATTQGWTTPYVIVNKGSTSANVNISYYNQANGLNVGNYSVSILPGASKFVFREWTTNTDGSAVVVSDQPITVMVDQFNNGQNKFGAYTPIG